MPMKRSRLLSTLLASALIPSFACAQETVKSNQPAENAANPEMAKLAKALAGDWNTSESMVKSEFFPNGGSPHGRSHIGLVAGGTSLFPGFHSNGSAGKLGGLFAFWWEKPANIYRLFVFFHDLQTPPQLRGTAPRGGGTFVNNTQKR